MRITKQKLINLIKEELANEVSLEEETLEEVDQEAVTLATIRQALSQTFNGQSASERQMLQTFIQNFGKAAAGGAVDRDPTVRRQMEFLTRAMNKVAGNDSDAGGGGTLGKDPRRDGGTGSGRSKANQASVRATSGEGFGSKANKDAPSLADLGKSYGGVPDDPSAPDRNQASVRATSGEGFGSKADKETPIKTRKGIGRGSTVQSDGPSPAALAGDRYSTQRRGFRPAYLDRALEEGQHSPGSKVTKNALEDLIKEAVAELINK